jgi:4-hydroxy-tetrahydrodipicolinate synthase
MSATLPRGIVPVLQTPFAADGGIDYECVERLVEDALAGGASGFLAPAVASEVGTLTGEERSELVPFLVKALRGRVPLIAGCSSSNAEESAQLAEAAEQAGADACLMAVPEPGDAVEFFRRAMRRCRLPLVVQDLDWTGPGLPVETLERLCGEVPQIHGSKIETIPAGPKYTRVREVMGAGFHVSGGWAAPQMIEALDRGVDALIPEASMVRVYSAIWRSHAAESRVQAQDLFRRLLPVLTFTNQEIRLSIAFYKRLLARKGVFRSAAMRVTGFAWDEFNLRVADELIEYYLELEGGLRSM